MGMCLDSKGPYPHIDLAIESTDSVDFGIELADIGIESPINEYIGTEDMKLLHNQLRLSMLCTRRRKFILKLIFKLSKIEENVELYRPDIRLRGREKVRMHKPYSNKERVLKSPYYLAVNLWNQLDEEMQTIQNRFDFKKRLNFVDVDSLKIGTER